MPIKLGYRRVAGIIVRAPRSKLMTTLGAVLGLLVGILVTQFARIELETRFGTTVAGWKLLLGFMAVGAAGFGFVIGRGVRVRLLAAREIHEDRLRCNICGTETWHVIRSFDAGFQLTECLTCRSSHWSGGRLADQKT